MTITVHIEDHNITMPIRIEDNTILLGYRGSISHGTYIPPEEEMGTDDIDLIGVFVSSSSHYLGFQKYEGKETKIDHWDIVTYEIRKFFSMLKNSNPNVLPLLWLRESDYILVTDVGKQLLLKKHLFLSKNAYNSFCGYATSEYKRIMKAPGYNVHMPSRRLELFNRFGYNPKAASHAIRILRMGVELLSFGSMNVFREDAQELIDIKKGCWTHGKVEREIQRLFAELRDAYETSPLPDQPEINTIEKFMIDTIYHFVKVDIENQKDD